MQAGKQLEYATGGLIKAGYHEVVVNEKTMETIERRKVEVPERPLIRISSTLFWHLNSDFDLAPVPELAERARQVRDEQKLLGRDEGAEAAYPATKVGHQVERYVGKIESAVIILWSVFHKLTVICIVNLSISL